MNIKGLTLFILTIMFTSLFVVAVNTGNGKPEKDGLIILMNSKQNRLVVQDSDKNTPNERIEKILFNGKDYTAYADELIKTRPLALISARFLIFGENYVTLTGDTWTCKEGIVFIPREKEVIFIDARDIVFHDDTQVFNAKDARISTLSLENKQKEEKSTTDLSINLEKYK
jgi:hypothetical protein